MSTFSVARVANEIRNPSHIDSPIYVYNNRNNDENDNTDNNYIDYNDNTDTTQAITLTLTLRTLCLVWGYVTEDNVH